MKFKYIISLLITTLLTSCASVNFNTEEKMLGSYPVSISSEDFQFSELLLLTTIDHEKKQIEKCHGLFPDAKERSELSNLYMQQKSQNKINFEKQLILSMVNKKHEYVLFHIAGDENTVGGSIKGCERLMHLYQAEGYKIVNP